MKQAADTPLAVLGLAKSMYSEYAKPRGEIHRNMQFERAYLMQ